MPEFRKPAEECPGSGCWIVSADIGQTQGWCAFCFEAFGAVAKGSDGYVLMPAHSRDHVTLEREDA